MPYTSKAKAPPALRGIKPALTLGQMNIIASWADAIQAAVDAGESEVDNPWSIAIANFKKAYTVRGGKWTKRQAKAEENDMEFGDSWKIEVDGKQVAVNELVEAWQTLNDAATKTVKVPDAPPVEEMDDDDYPTYAAPGAMTFADLQAYEDIRTQSRRIQTLTTEFNMLVNNIMYSEVDKPAALRSLFDEFIALIDAELGEAAEPDSGEQTFTESMSGAVIQLAEADVVESGGPRSPLEMDVILIQPGFGNKKNNHYYPADVLARDSRIFEGVKMYTTDHRPGEKSVRTEVSKIKSIVGLTQGRGGIADGSPIARVVVFDPAFAEMVRNRATVNELDSLECSILATGIARKGKVNGQTANVVESITAASSVDWVSRAGAGGRALNLAESEVDMDIQEEQVEEAVVEQEAEQVILSEDAEPVEDITPEPAQETEDNVTEDGPPAIETELLAEAQVRELIGNRLPDAAAEWLLEAQYTTNEQVMEAVAKAQQRIKALTGSGAVLGQTARTQETATMTPEKYQARLDEADRRHGVLV